MTDLTFTRLLHDIGLRHWDLRGPAGLIRFEIADIRHAAVYLHGTVAPGGTELTPCDLCGKCWHDAMTPDVAQALYDDWKTAAYHDAVIRTQLEKWYTENLERWAADAALDGVQAVPAKNLAMLLAELVPDLPIVTAATIAAALDEAGYEITRKPSAGETGDAPAATHDLAAGWGGVPGQCGVECACGLTFDGFDTIAEAATLLDRHIAAEAGASC